jgi:hypothetical protein
MNEGVGGGCPPTSGGTKGNGDIVDLPGKFRLFSVY